MKKSATHILHHLLSASVLLMLVVAESARADSIIRIIGDKTTEAPNISGEAPTAEPPPSSVGGKTSIRIVGDKPSNIGTPANAQTAKPLLSSPKGIRDVVNKNGIVPAQKQPPTELPTSIATVDPEEQERLEVEKRLATIKSEEKHKADEKVELERLVKLKAEQEQATAEAIQLEIKKLAAEKEAQERLMALKADEERRASERAEQERLAKAKIAQEQAVEKQVQERMAALKAAEEREAERERIAKSKAEEERLAAARRTIDVIPIATPYPLLQPLAVIPTPDLPAISSNDIKPAVPETVQLKLEQNKSDISKITVNETIWDLYLSAKANDPALGRTEARVTGNKADSDILLAGLMPHVDSTAGLRQTSQTVANYGGASDGSYDFTAINYNVSARMTLLHIPTIYSLSAAAASLRIEEAGVVAARQNLIVKFTDSYFALLKAQTDKQIAQGEINRLKQVLVQSKAFLKAGTGDVIAVYEAQSRLDGADADLTRSESSLRLTEQKLSSVVGRPVKSIVNYLQQQPIGPEPDDLDWWVATMEKEQPVMRQAREGIIQTAEQRKSVKAEYLPILQASGGYDVNRGTAALPTAEVRQWFVGATLSMPLYSGGETSAKVRRAVASEEERKHVFDETMDQQRENVKQAFFNLRYNISFIRALEQKKASAEIQLAAIKKGRNIGTRSAIDLLNAEQAYSIAMRDLQNTLYDNFIRVIQLKSAAGILGEEDVAFISKTAALP